MVKLIGEIGINHNASYKTLIDLTDMVLDSGFDYAKIQLRTPEICVPEDQWRVPRQWFDGTVIPYIEYKRRMELDDDLLSCWMNKYKGRVTASVWDIPSLEKLTRFNDIPFIKIPSALLTDHKLIKAAIDTNIPILLSTGMSTIEEIDDAVRLFPENHAFSLMQCTSSYPVAPEEINLKVIRTMLTRYGVPVGYSSHDPSPMSAAYAMALGASSIETHVTLDRAMQGSDHGASLERKGIEFLVRERDRLRLILGDGYKKLYKSELKSRKKLRGN